MLTENYQNIITETKNIIENQLLKFAGNLDMNNDSFTLFFKNYIQTGTKDQINTSNFDRKIHTP